MAQTVTQRITELENRLSSITTKIEAQEGFRSLEEGSASARFITSFTEINSLYQERDKLRNRLTILGWEGI